MPLIHLRQQLFLYRAVPEYEILVESSIPMSVREWLPVGILSLSYLPDACPANWLTSFFQVAYRYGLYTEKENVDQTHPGHNCTGVPDR